MLSKEIISLVQNIELNKAGWREKTIQRLILASIWFLTTPSSEKSIQEFLDSTFHLLLSDRELKQVLSSMISQNVILQFSNDTYKIPDNQRKILEKEMSESEKVEKDAKDIFCKLVIEIHENLDANHVWDVFQNKFLDPLIKQVGINTYQFIAGEKIIIDNELLVKFRDEFPIAIKPKLQSLVLTYIDPRKPEVRSYFSRMLHARFCIDACGLPDDVLGKLNTKLGKQLQFKIFVDTNFLFSLLDLHENPSNFAAEELRNILAKLKGNPHVVLYITPETIKEAKTSIINSEQQLKGIPLGQNFVDAALQSHISGLAQRFLLEKKRRGLFFSVEDWFEPYIKDFVSLARSRNVELFNEKHDEYSTRSDVLEDIALTIQSEERFPENRRKSYEKVAHDMILWHYVHDKRSAYVESPMDAVFYILTVDFRLIGFDDAKRKNHHSNVPLCIHPATFIQLLQFWIPRTKEFEEAMLGSLCLPFISQDLDSEDEKTTLKILKGIGRFEKSNEFKEETITHIVFSEGLRSRLKISHSDDEERQLIRDAIIEELRLRVNEEKRRAENSEEELHKKDERIAELSKQTVLIHQQYECEKKQREEAEGSAQKSEEIYDSKIFEMSKRITELENDRIARDQKDNEERQTKERRKSRNIYLSCLFIILLASLFSGWRLYNIFSKNLSSFILSLSIGILISVILFILLHWLLEISIGKKYSFSGLFSFKIVKRFHKWLWGTVIFSFLLSIFTSLFSDEIKKEMDGNSSNLPNIQNLENNNIDNQINPGDATD
jgi:hypothetical protein